MVNYRNQNTVLESIQDNHSKNHNISGGYNKKNVSSQRKQRENWSYKETTNLSSDCMRNNTQ